MSLVLDLSHVRLLDDELTRERSERKHPGSQNSTSTATKEDDRDDAAPGPEEINRAYSDLDRRLTKLHQSLPPLTALIIFTGHSDPREMSALAAKKAKFDKLWRTVKQSEIAPEDRWMESDDRKLIDEVERCRYGLSFYCVKSS